MIAHLVDVERQCFRMLVVPLHVLAPRRWKSVSDADPGLRRSPALVVVVPEAPARHRQAPRAQLQ